ncbi:MAG: hypothetical protein J6M18_04355 [Actinomycetaceae bacterium]|nr:hypothetical protein [Actinomycetaceae bacterium]
MNISDTPHYSTIDDDIAISKKEKITFHISDLSEPAFINIRYFYTVTEDGLPNDTDDFHIECIKKKASCDIKNDEKNIYVQAFMDERAVFIVVELFYYNPSEVNEPYSIVTYGFHVK